MTEHETKRARLAELRVKHNKALTAGDRVELSDIEDEIRALTRELNAPPAPPASPGRRLQIHVNQPRMNTDGTDETGKGNASASRPPKIRDNPSVARKSEADHGRRIGERMRAARTEAGWTGYGMTKEMLAKTGIKQFALSMSETGAIHAPAVLEKFCEFLKVNRSWLETGSGQMFTGDPPLPPSFRREKSSQTKSDEPGSAPVLPPKAAASNPPKVIPSAARKTAGPSRTCVPGAQADGGDVKDAFVKIYLMSVDDRPRGFTRDAGWAIEWAQQLAGRSVTCLGTIDPA